MDKQIVNVVVYNSIIDKIRQMLDETSTNEFVEMICDKSFTEMGVDVQDNQDEVRMIIGENVISLNNILLKYVSDNDPHKKLVKN